MKGASSLLRKQSYTTLFATFPRTGLLAAGTVAISRMRLARTDAGTIGGSARKKIMLVDDEKDISMVLKSGLERHGFDVEVYNSPFDALSQFKPGQYDMLLLDIRMPGMSGFELYDKIKKLDGNVKVRMISAFEVHEDESKRYFSGEETDQIIKKPVTVRALASIIDSELSGKTSFS
jgi:DNA-binding response OmpR family regulator